MRTFRYRGYTRAAFVARHLAEAGFDVSYDGGSSLSTDAARDEVSSVPAGHATRGDIQPIQIAA